MTTGYYCAIFPFCGGGKKKGDKKTKAFYDWATTVTSPVFYEYFIIKEVNTCASVVDVTSMSVYSRY